MFLDHFISLTDLRCKTHVMNHANRLAETLLISPFISFILYRGISRVIGLMSDKRLETQSFCLPFAACNCIVLWMWAHIPLAIFYPSSSQTRRKHEEPVRARPSIRRIITEYPTGDKKNLKGGWCARGRRKKNARTRVRFIVKRTGLCRVYKCATHINSYGYLFLFLSLAMKERRPEWNKEERNHTEREREKKKCDSIACRRDRRQSHTSASQLDIFAVLRRQREMAR